ncbi:Chaperone protein dnaJ 50 [Hibiscus syriacus]|uniref:Chaperone protein dnaJ 50 n=1 Tax=Hibiscus syriacus TaxID=106335 RepID=A0A6A3CXR9_HIBSY|nr:Chaperone protein dnaJ 50 [Hibiscus syriacus]
MMAPPESIRRCAVVLTLVNPDPESRKFFVEIANAYEILKDEATREQYDYAISHPEEVFYNTACYYRAYYGHKTAVDIVKKTPAYKNRLWALELERSGGTTNKKKSNRQMDKKKEEDLSKELELDIKGAEKLSIWELIGVRFILLPYTIGKLLLWYGCWFWRYKVKKAPYSWEDAAYLTRNSLREEKTVVTDYQILILMVFHGIGFSLPSCRPSHCPLTSADASPKTPALTRPQFIGRNDVSVADKRLSRKHIALTTTPEGSSDLFVEGTNPVVVRYGKVRKKLASLENASISNGDIVELIPGHHLFKYVSSSSTGENKRSFNEANSDGENLELAAKKKRNQGSKNEANSANQLKAEEKDSSNKEHNCVEAISGSQVPNDKLPHTFRLLKVQGDSRLDLMKKRKPNNWILHKPPLPISFGTHHSKAMLLVYPKEVRVIVHTANLIYVDWNYKSQGLWMQDFPWKDQSKSIKGCGFENDLIDYLSTLKECVFDKEFQRSPLIYQFSSLGSLDEKWMVELATSMPSGYSEDKTPLGLGEPLIIWPTVEDVRCSLEGYAAGNAIPSPLKNVEKGFLKNYWAKWKASHTGRCCAMPHIRTFIRYKGQQLAWFLLTSANLSKAA